jgi:hypothetical protein
MPYEVRAKIGDGNFSVVVETAAEALAKIAELIESGAEVLVKDLLGAVVDIVSLDTEASDGL